MSQQSGVPATTNEAPIQGGQWIHRPAREPKRRLPASFTRSQEDANKLGRVADMMDCFLRAENDAYAEVLETKRQQLEVANAFRAQQRADIEQMTGEVMDLAGRLHQFVGILGQLPELFTANGQSVRMHVAYDELGTPEFLTSNYPTVRRNLTPELDRVSEEGSTSEDEMSEGWDVAALAELADIDV